MPPLPSLALQPHPTDRIAGFAVAAGAAFAPDGALRLHYRIRGEAAHLRLPAAAAPGPADGLWQHTCCEAFVAAPDGTAYREFNFSPSGQWACYAFNDYRQRDTAFIVAAAPHFTVERLADGLALAAELPAALLPARGPLQLGLSLVLETADGAKSYWALAHAAPQPDFHLRQSFGLALPPDTP